MEPSGLGEIIKRLRVDNALPFLLLGFMALSAVLFGLAAHDLTAMRWVFAGVGAGTALTAVSLCVFAALRMPSLIRTERHEQIMRYMDLLESTDFDGTSQRELGSLIGSQGETTVSKRGAIRDPRRETKP